MSTIKRIKHWRLDLKLKLYLPFINFAFLILGMACQDSKNREKKSLENKLSIFFASNYMDTSQYAIDSFSIVDIDTLTNKHLLREQQNLLTVEYEDIVANLSQQVDKMKDRNQQISLAVMIESKSLVNYYKEEVEQIKEQAEALNLQADSIERIFQRLTVDLENSDSIKPVGFQAKCLYQLRGRDHSVKRDTAYLFLNDFGDIIKREDLIKPVYEFNREKF